MESNGSITMSPRRRPLHTCGSSILATGHIVYKKGPLGSITRKLANQASSLVPHIISIIQYNLLAILTFTDDQILSLETKAEKFFPPSKHVFEKIDELLKIAEIIPGKVDYAINELPANVKKVSFRNWVLVCMISWLKLLISVLSQLKCKTSNEGEETMMIDKSCNDSKSCVGTSIGSKNSNHCKQNRDFPNRVETNGLKRTKPNVPKVTYKEALEKGKPERKRDSMKNLLQKFVAASCSEEKICEEVKKGEEKNESTFQGSDSILELFESGWIMKQVSISRESSRPLGRSISYT